MRDLLCGSEIGRARWLTGRGAVHRLGSRFGPIRAVAPAQHADDQKYGAHRTDGTTTRKPDIPYTHVGTSDTISKARGAREEAASVGRAARAVA
ncbi:hypothetical protein GCM10009764_35530 [Nocardia ninae]|uniref:Uncharacterized protein n=1 Tax=Nocardia ninae NBRC 108245 TaxID=1210091 RepID=A0A511MNJ1_9NOCA|nr:hypothetical protein NN4_62870 [Nocardia ninae NBRC 108245]